MGQTAPETRKSLKKAKPADYLYQASSIRDLKFEHGFCGERFDSFTNPIDSAKVAPSVEQTCSPAGYLLIPFFGKSHYVSPSLYVKEAKKYHQIHWKESWYLLDSIRDNRAIYDEWANPRGFFEGFLIAGAVKKWTDFRDAWDNYFNEVETAPKPDIKQFNDLSDRTYDVIHRLVDLNYEADHVAKNGFDLQSIRQDTERLLAVIRQYRENCIESAEQITTGLETVESTSFQILNIVPTLTLMDPIREAAYKISILFVRAGARGAGGYLADGTVDGVLREAFAILLHEAPNVIVDVTLSWIQRLCVGLRLGKVAKESFVLAVKHLLEFTCAYYRLVQQNADGKLTDQQLEQLLSERIAVMIGDIAGQFLGTSLGEKAWKTLVKSVSDSLIRTLLVDINNARIAAKEQNREVIEVFMADLPSTIMRIFQGAFVGLIQRRAQQTAQYIEQQRATVGDEKEKGLNYQETLETMRKTNLTEWARDGTVDKKTLQSIQQSRRPPLLPFDYRTFTTTAWAKTNLDYITAAHARRNAHDNNLVLISHVSSETRRLHTDTGETLGAKAPKPMDVKGKTSDHPSLPDDIRGLVMKPRKEGEPGGPTHKDYAKGNETWEKGRDKMFAAGFMVRDDGVVFHPVQLTVWAKLHAEDSSACERAVETLQKAAAAGYHDLTLAPPATLSKQISEQLGDIRSILNKAKIGLYSDWDLIEVVDFQSGVRRFMGDKGDGSDALRLARDNRQHLNKEINIHNDFEDERIPPNLRMLARIYDEPGHGGSSEIEPVILAKTFDNVEVPIKKTSMIFPNGELVIIDETDSYVAGKIAGLTGELRTKRLDWAIRDRIEKELQSRLGDKYQDFANRGQNVRKSYEKKSPIYITTGKSPPPVTIKQVGEIRKTYRGIEILDEEGLGYEVTKEAIENSLYSRHMRWEDYHINHLFEDSPVQENKYRQWNRYKVWGDFRTIVAVDYDRGDYIGRNIAIAVSHYEQTIADAIEGLLRTREQLGAIYSNVQVWYELYTAYSPICTDYVVNRIGGPKPGVVNRGEELAKMVSCFRPRKDERLHAFAVTTFADTYAPLSHKDFIDKRPVQGLVLAEVWEHQKTKKLIYRKLETAENCQILVFPESLIAFTHIKQAQFR